jgi:sugar phosphate isomerase/epimerase
MKYSVCNELFGPLPFGRACAIAKAEGFSGIEIAPFTLFGDFSDDDIARGVAEARNALAGEGLAFAGFHWLMTKPEGMSLVSPSAPARAVARRHLARLVEAAGELGGGALVLGSPKQRRSFPGQGRDEATRFLCETLADLAPTAAACRSKILLEQLSPDQTDVVNTMDEAIACVESIGSPAIDGMFDYHNACGESASWEALIEKHLRHIKHVHVNEVDGRAPGTGTSNYSPSFEILRRGGYDGWISMEIFEVPDDPEETLRGAMELFRKLEKA